MKLYHYFRSSASYRVRIALNLKGVACESQDVELRAPVSAQRSAGFRAVNPEGLVPVLVDGGRTITQSLAIVEYLDEVYREPPLLPRVPADRAQVRAMALAIACDIHPLNNSQVLAYLNSPLGAAEPAVDAWYAHWITRGFAALEEQIRGGSGGERHMFGDSVTLADLCIVPQMYNARRRSVDVGPFPRLRAICAHLEALPAFRQAAPEAQAAGG